jgi:hypothetical protein
METHHVHGIAGNDGTAVLPMCYQFAELIFTGPSSFSAASLTRRCQRCANSGDRQPDNFTSGAK